ncbi:MAG: type II toxin-antitoxin system Phd/YefM family antitoxin [Enterococcus aquimarinus]
MTLKKLEVPTTSITEVKKSPMDVFQQARDARTGVYVFNREKIAGVMLTQEQYETLLQELEESRQKIALTERADTQAASVSIAEKLTPENASVEDSTISGLEEFFQEMRQTIVTGSLVSAKNLDERMVALGFITKKSGFGGVIGMITELKESGKIIYHLRRKPEGKTIVAEVIGEPDNQSQLFDKLIVKRIHLREN